jgi:carboxylesterase type B
MLTTLIMMAVAMATTTVSGTPTTTVSTTHGPILGLDFSTYRQWLGVPFAKPPLGALRFTAPQPPTPWTSAYDARNHSIACAQSHNGPDTGTLNKTEDCLYVNVWAPPVGKYGSARAAVMLFWHGGDFKEGSNAFQIYDGRHIASTTNTVLVVPNYRLGVFGFLYAGGSGGIDSNVAILDQRRALQWAFDNVATFGGDPHRITIFGQSAGAESVLLHVAAPAAPTAHIIKGAISESGPIDLFFKSPSDAILLTDAFAALLGCSSGTTTPDAACLRSKSTDDVLKAADQAVIIPRGASEAVMRWSPVIDGLIVPDQTMTAFANGKILPVPLMIGSNLKDGMLFAYAIAGNDHDLSWEEYAAIVLGLFQSDWYFDILNWYRPVFGGDNRPILSEMLTDYFMTCTARFTIRLAEKAGAAQTYLYRFSRGPPFNVWPKSQSYCNGQPCHGSELPYVYFDTGAPFPWNFTQIDTSLGLAISSFWTSFAATGSPGGNWPLFRNATSLSLELNWPLQQTQGLRDKYCNFLDKVGYIHGTGAKSAMIQNAKASLEKFRRRK